MVKYIIKRLFVGLITFFGITLIVYLLASAAPGNPIDMLVDTSAPEEVRHAMEVKLGLDQPVIVQYFKWLTQMLTGNMGISYRTSNPVFDEVMNRVGPTLLLTVTALVVALIISIPFGIWAAYKPYSVVDYATSGLSFLGASAPNFFVGLVLIYFFAIKFKCLPNSGMYYSLSDQSLSSLVLHMILPVTVLSLQLVGGFLRQMRSSMIESLDNDYVNTARSKGLGEGRVVFIHALKNAFIPMLAQIGLSLPLLIGGAVVTEQLFNWPGLGSLMVLSISSRDYPMIMSITALISVFVLVGNIIVDLLYGVLDPRIRYDNKRKGGYR